MSDRDYYRNRRIRRFRRKVALLVVLLITMTVLILALVVLVLKRDHPSGFNNDNNDEMTSETYSEMEVFPLFVGDSRTVGMSEALYRVRGINIDSHAKSGSSIGYFKSLDERIRQSGADSLVIGFGVNDLNDIDDYIEYANQLGSELNKPVFFMTVNPVDEGRAERAGYRMKNSRINDFNLKLEGGAVNYTVINTNIFLYQEGFNTVDGLHYDDETYIKIYDFIMDYLTHRAARLSGVQ